MGVKFFLSIDLGTSGDRVFCFDEKMKPLSSAYAEHSQIFPRDGWVEHDAMEILRNVTRLTAHAINQVSLESRDAISIGITNQRETTVVWNRETGMPAYNAIVWQCRRTAETCEKMKRDGYEDLVRKKTGLVIDAYFSATKISWILNHLREKGISTQNLIFGTIDCWILWNLTGGKVHATDHTNASRTMIYDIGKMTWDEEIAGILNIPLSVLPEVKNSAVIFGKTRGFPSLPDGISISGICGDQQASLLGHACTEAGMLKNTYGTGCFMLEHTGHELKYSSNGLLTTIACDSRGLPAYAIEGSVFIGGAVIQWLRDNMNFFAKSDQSEEMARNADDDELIFIPALAGLGAPYWRSDIKGTISGITRKTSQNQIVRAALKGIAFRCMELLRSLEADTGRKAKELRADGGASSNSFLMQFQADILQIPVAIPEISETTALGAAFAAGIGCGCYKSVDEIKESAIISGRFFPSDYSSVCAEVERWNSLVRKIIG